MKATSSLSLVELEYLEIKLDSQGNHPQHSDTISFPPVQKVRMLNSFGANSSQNIIQNFSIISVIWSIESSNSSIVNTMASFQITQKTLQTQPEQGN